MQKMPYNVEEITSKGKGCVATEFIPRGALILKESPILTYTSLAEAQTKYNQLEDAQKDDVMALASNQLTGNNLIDICATNAFEKDNCDIFAKGHPFYSNMTGTSSALYLEASRFNHSCCPNALFFDQEIRAVDDIQPGEEIAISYLALSKLRNRAERQEHLRLNFQFTCGCRLCTADDRNCKKNDIQRSVLASQIKAIKQFEDNCFSGFNLKATVQNGAPQCAQRLRSTLAMLEREDQDIPLKPQCLVSYFTLKCSAILLSQMCSTLKINKDEGLPSNPDAAYRELLKEAKGCGTLFEGSVKALKTELAQLKNMN